MRRLTIVLIVVMVLTGWLLGSCTIPTIPQSPKAEWMVPKLDTDAQLDQPVYIWIANVEGGKSPWFEMAYIENDSFQSALTQTLDASGIVLVPDTKSISKYSLSATILNQVDDHKFHHLGYGSYTATLEIQYNLRRSNTNQTVWEEIHRSEFTRGYGFDAPPVSNPATPRDAKGEEFYYSSAIISIAEGAARENLSWLVQELSMFLLEEEEKQN